MHGADQLLKFQVRQPIAGPYRDHRWDVRWRVTIAGMGVQGPISRPSSENTRTGHPALERGIDRHHPAYQERNGLQVGAC